MGELEKKKCVPCRGGIPPLDSAEIRPLLEQLNQWEAVENHHLKKTFTFENFVSALGFVNQIGAIAEAEDHHPDLYLAWGRVAVEIWTHKINGLSESDFILAAKIDALWREQ
jgi:4a-hydroxytetrahydrobiopterin dehydratase